MAATGALPDVAPMLAVPGPVPSGPGWAYEFKWDGVRAIVYLDRGRVRVLSRNGRDITGGYPELAALGAAYPDRRLILDGEIVALGPDGAPSFGLLQQRMHVRSPDAALRARVPARLYAFDVLFDGEPILALPYAGRRARLEELVWSTPTVQTPPSWTDAHGADLVSAAAELGLEGVVAKRITGTYQPGRRSPAWVKTPREITVEVVVGGWKPGAGRRTGTVGSLLLGMYDDAGLLRFVGHVGTGFTDAMLRDLATRLTRLGRDTSPYDEPVPREHGRDARWAHPRLVGEVVFRSWTPDGRLRHPSWRGLRPDKHAEQVQGPEMR